MWSIDSCKEIRTFFGHTEFISTILFIKNEKILVSSGGDRYIGFWDIASGKPIHILD